MDDRQLKYLDMLQAVIARMAGNQFTCRTWSVTIGTALIGYAIAKDSKPEAALLAILPAVCFWVLDAYYLALERGFRTRFDAALKQGEDDASFNFHVSVSAAQYLRAALSLAVWVVHLPVVCLALIVGRRLWLK